MISNYRIDRVPLPDMGGAVAGGAVAGGAAMGRMFACGFSAVGGDPEAALDSVGATTMVCLLTRAEIDMRYPDYAKWLEAHAPVDGSASSADLDGSASSADGSASAADGSASAADGSASAADGSASSADLAKPVAIEAIWLPVNDGEVTNDHSVLELVQQVVTHLRHGRSVMAHCGAGMARTAVVCILTMVALGADLAAATAEFRQARPGGGPDGPAQEHQIARLAASLVNPPTVS